MVACVYEYRLTVSDSMINSSLQFQSLSIAYRYNMQRLTSRITKTDEKWRISAASFANEYVFCSAVMHKGAPLRESGVRMPAIYLAESTGPSPGDGKGGGYLDRSYDFVFEYLSSDLFHQSSELQLQEAKAALELLARFHAYFWVPGVENGGGDEHRDLRTALFQRGAWWRKELRPSVRYDRIAEAFRGLCLAFPEPELMGDLDNDEAHGLMKLLEDR